MSQTPNSPSTSQNTPPAQGKKLLDHKDVKTTMKCTHVLQRGRLAVKSPLDD